jgi:hypothetical protein
MEQMLERFMAAAVGDFKQHLDFIEICMLFYGECLLTAAPFPGMGGQ